MSAFVITIFILHVISVGSTMNHLGKNQYPRVVTNTRGEDYFTLIISAAFAIWAGVLIF